MRLLRGISLLLFLALGCYAVALSVENSHQALVRNTVERLVMGNTVPSEQIARAAELALEQPISHHCRSNILRPGLLAILHDLNRFNQASEYDKWAAAHTTAQAYVRAMARCLPYDGNMWLRDALISRAIAENPDDLKPRLTLARQLMPYEDLQVSARIVLWKRLGPFSLSALSDLARADIRAVLLYGSDDMKASLQEAMSPEFGKLVRRERETIGLPPASS